MNEILWKMAGGLALLTCLLIILNNVALRKKIFVTHPKTVGKASVKVSKDVAKSVTNRWQKLNSKKPQLPGGISQAKNYTPATTSPAKIPKPGGIIPVTINTDPSYGFGNVEFKYLDGCNGYTLFETGPNNESLAFECVAGYDERTDKYTVWFYKVKYHRDSRKKNNEYHLSNEGTIERSY